MFQRQWYRRTLEQRSGLSLDEWEAALHEMRGSPAAAARFAPDLRRLAAYFAGLENDARGFIRDPEKLEEAIGAQEARRSIAENAASAWGGPTVTGRSQG